MGVRVDASVCICVPVYLETDVDAEGKNGKSLYLLQSTCLAFVVELVLQQPIHCVVHDAGAAAASICSVVVVEEVVARDSPSLICSLDNLSWDSSW